MRVTPSHWPSKATRFSCAARSIVARTVVQVNPSVPFACAAELEAKCLEFIKCLAIIKIAASTIAGTMRAEIRSFRYFCCMRPMESERGTVFAIMTSNPTSTPNDSMPDSPNLLQTFHRPIKECALLLPEHFTQGGPRCSGGRFDPKQKR